MRLGSRLLPVLLSAALLAYVVPPLARLITKECFTGGFVRPVAHRISRQTQSKAKEQDAEELLAEARALREELLKEQGVSDAAAIAKEEQKKSLAAMPDPEAKKAPPPAAAEVSVPVPAPTPSPQPSEPQEVMMPDPDEWTETLDGSAISLGFFVLVGIAVFVCLNSDPALRT